MPSPEQEVSISSEHIRRNLERIIESSIPPQDKGIFSYVYDRLRNRKSIREIAKAQILETIISEMGGDRNLVTERDFAAILFTLHAALNQVNVDLDQKATSEFIEYIEAAEAQETDMGQVKKHIQALTKDMYKGFLRDRDRILQRVKTGEEEAEDIIAEANKIKPSKSGIIQGLNAIKRNTYDRFTEYYGKISSFLDLSCNRADLGKIYDKAFKTRYFESVETPETISSKGIRDLKKERKLTLRNQLHPGRLISGVSTIIGLGAWAYGMPEVGQTIIALGGGLVGGINEVGGRLLTDKTSTIPGKCGELLTDASTYTKSMEKFLKPVLTLAATSYLLKFAAPLTIVPEVAQNVNGAGGIGVFSSLLGTIPLAYYGNKIGKKAYQKQTLLRAKGVKITPNLAKAVIEVTAEKEKRNTYLGAIIEKAEEAENFIVKNASKTTRVVLLTFSVGLVVAGIGITIATLGFGAPVGASLAVAGSWPFFTTMAVGGYYAFKHEETTLVQKSMKVFGIKTGKEPEKKAKSAPIKSVVSPTTTKLAKEKKGNFVTAPETVSPAARTKTPTKTTPVRGKRETSKTTVPAESPASTDVSAPPRGKRRLSHSARGRPSHSARNRLRRNQELAKLSAHRQS